MLFAALSAFEKFLGLNIFRRYFWVIFGMFSWFMIDVFQNRHEEIREVLRKADVMVESTDEGQSQVYQAMAISLKDAWKELMMRMEERKILLEMAIGFYRSGDDYQQHLEYAFAVCNSTLIADNIEQV